ncbi:hypothetical protein HU200_058507 [Digitaria exilis]|uniref:DUF1618 domain-containing protein n=1 Tax=Digitaria exilis TaxID=1010633 RepID=A0A835DZ28_9POAL|nr:hypothetical protein HU200_058507 [Digitaria exilis]
MVIFRHRNHSKRVYYLAYDVKDASMYMIPCIPRDLEATYTPSTRTNSARDSTGPWAIKEHSSSKLPQAFSADVMFSFGDKVFWGDLSQGIAYSDLRKGDSAAFVKLPREYLVDFSVEPMYAQTNMYRTMGCVQGSVKFVCINRSVRAPGYTMVRVWTLDLGHKQWMEEKGFPCMWKDLWKNSYHLNSGLRFVVPPEPQYPILTPDGVLSVLLPKALLSRGGKEADYICSFDILSHSCLYMGEVFNYHTIGPVILPSNFFNSHPRPLEWKRAITEPTPKRKLTSIVGDLKLPTEETELPTEETKLPTPKRKLSSIVRQEPTRMPAFV